MLRHARHLDRAAGTAGHPGVLATIVALMGFLAATTWFAWRFGPTLARVSGFCSWWVGRAAGSQGGYGYMVAFLIFGTLAWTTGTIWFAKRRGRWPSALSARLFNRLLGDRTPVRHVQLPAVLIARDSRAR